MIHFALTEEEIYGNGNNDGGIVYSKLWWALYILYSVRVAMRLAFFLYFLVLTIRTRQLIRGKYDIPKKQCGSLEDCW